MRRAPSMAALVFVLVLSCTRARVTPHNAYDAQTITEAEIVSSNAINAYEVIVKLRSNFLSYRGETNFYASNSKSMPTVYVDEQRYGEITVLENIPALQVASIRLYRAWEATTRYGTGNMSGVIAVTTRR
jgi:hypothetical protein